MYMFYYISVLIIQLVLFYIWCQKKLTFYTFKRELIFHLLCCVESINGIFYEEKNIFEEDLI